MVSQNQYNTLKKAPDSYLSHEDFGIRDIENVMSEIFGSERAGEEAVSWTRYWNELNVYEERLRVTHNGGDVPKVCTEFSSTRKCETTAIKWKLNAQSRDLQKAKARQTTPSHQRQDHQSGRRRMLSGRRASNGDLDW